MAKLPEDSDGPIAPKAKAADPKAAPRYYIVTTPNNLQFSGRVMGVQFVAGRGELIETTLDPRLKKTLAQIVQEFREMSGYVLTPVE